MRIPIRGESDAFYIAMGGAGLIGVSVAVGAVAGVGAALFAGGLLGAAVWEVAGRDVDRRLSLREAASEGPRNEPAARRSSSCRGESHPRRRGAARSSSPARRGRG
jgi:hypothetical protein